MQVFEVFGDLIFRDGNTRERLQRIGQQVDTVQRNFQGFATNMQLFGGSLVNFGTSLTNNVSIPLLTIGKDSIFLASDLNEAFNVVDVTFKKNAGEVKDWATKLLERFGMVQLESIQYVGSMGAMLKSSGLSANAATHMSKRLVELTGDMSSFYNLNHEEMWEKIRSGISGETEPLKALGINMSVANLEAYALSEGIKTSWNEMDQGEQVALRYGYLMKVTADAQGDFARTSDSFSNKLRILEGRFTDLKTKLGDVLLPVVDKALTFFLNLVGKIEELPKQVKLAAGGFAGFAIILGPLITLIGGATIAIGTLIAIIGFISTPILLAGAGIAAFVAELTIFGSILTFVGLKTGLLQKAFIQTKEIVIAIALIFKGDLSKSFDILTKKIGMSREQASTFIGKMASLKLRIKQVIDVVKNITKLLGMIFTGKSKDMVDLLMKKFGMTALEAVHFKAEAEKLRKKILDLASQFKDTSIKGVMYLADKLKEAAKWIVDHRTQIAKAIEILIKFASKIISTARTAKTHFNAIKSTVKTVMDAASKAVDKLNNALFKVIGTAKKVVDKIKSIKMPNINLPQFATGVQNFAGGYAIVGEEGPELVRLPRGSDVVPNQKMKDVTTNLKPRIFNDLSINSGGGTTNNIINMTNIVRSDYDIDLIMDKVANVLKRRGVSYRRA